MRLNPQVLLLAGGRDQALADVVEAAALVEFEVQRLATADLALPMHLDAWCEIVVESGSAAASARGPARPRGPASRLPRVVIAPRTRSAIEWAVRDGAEAVVCVDAIAGSLRDSIRRVRAAGVKTMAGVVVSRVSGLSGPARQAALAALRTPRPLRTVGELGGLTGYSRTTLARGWKPLGASRYGQLQYFLDWVLLVHALGMKTRSVSWSDVAARLHVHERTLARTAERLCKVGLGATPLSINGLLDADSVGRALFSLFGTDERSEHGLAQNVAVRNDVSLRRVPTGGTFDANS